MKKTFKYLLLTLPAVWLLCFICYLYIDRPVAEWIAHIHLYPGTGIKITDFGIFITFIAYIFILSSFVVYYFLRLFNIAGRFMDCMMLACMSVPFAFFAKSTLQMVFGRAMLRYHNSNKLLFLRLKDYYGFKFFQNGIFPSGHMTILTAFVVAFWIFYPRLRGFYISLLSVMTICLLGMNYHFVSDIIGGAYLGLTITLALYQLAFGMEKKVLGS